MLIKKERIYLKLQGDQFIYLFDFGDMGQFKVTVLKFIENEEDGFVPEII